MRWKAAGMSEWIPNKEEQEIIKKIVDHIMVMGNLMFVIGVVLGIIITKILEKSL